MNNRSFLLNLQQKLNVTIEVSMYYAYIESIILFILRLKKYGFF